MMDCNLYMFNLLRRRHNNVCTRQYCKYKQTGRRHLETVIPQRHRGDIIISDRHRHVKDCRLLTVVAGDTIELIDSYMTSLIMSMKNVNTKLKKKGYIKQELV